MTHTNTPIYRPLTVPMFAHMGLHVYYCGRVVATATSVEAAHKIALALTNEYPVDSCAVMDHFFPA